MQLVNKLGISSSLAEMILGAIAVGNIASWLLALIPGPGWLVKAALASASYIVKHSGRAAAIAY
ncbi:hypothetical protein ERICIV_04393 [Paenibacillus larvae subsp. larvae]|uniref:Uncharacterized protein n=1 Tax=Paenibacillus larvae subsp. larvae TaxID=147375 RepID=A0A2L1UJQ3_9BACL|nr:hypothetical protein [Paenibacillus larvae]AQT84888.1 hypothetical protein B1222_11645 [Paenibacillus larvae subsp. pulvifaciens]AQZ46887.1 hypothetical protein B5S25_10080 [Paenibacillus larvae subsp. pulvifaciens]AVF28656.1 hypothetical protein ERICIII_04647 [Paenibacillus larvae subsp. larvae]AVF33162.1 hypothetical protein ERICIV_04393 [Paenibacillus larvae subsp. larvae]MBH0343075.1 hypothetical protein [Paenibacillus larvae]